MDLIGFLEDLIGFLKDLIGFLKDLIGFLKDLIGPYWAHGAHPMGPKSCGPGPILKKTYQILKETYTLKETYQILGRKIGRKIGKGEAKVTMGVVWTRGVLNFRKIL